MTEDRRVYDPYAPPPTVVQMTSGVAQTVASEGEPDNRIALSADQGSLVPDDLTEISRADLIALAVQHGVASYGSKVEIAERVRRVASGGS